MESKYNATEKASQGYQQTLVKLQTDHDQLNTEHSALRVAHDSLLSAQAGSTTRLEELEKRLAQASKDSQDAEAMHSNTMQQLNEALALVARGASTESAMAALQVENEGLLANLAEMRPKIVELTEAKLTLSEAVEARDKSIRNYEAQMKTLESELADMHSQASDSGKHNSEAKARVSALEGELDREKLAISDAYKAYEELQARLALAEQQFKDSELAKVDLRQRAEQSEARAARLDADLERRTREVTSLLGEVETRTRESLELRNLLERSRADLDTVSGEIATREDELLRLRLNGAKSPALNPATLAGETMELELSTMRSRIRTLEAEVFDAQAREHALQRHLAKIQDDALSSSSRIPWGVEGERSAELLVPSGKLGQLSSSSRRMSGELEDTRTGGGSTHALTPSNAVRPIRLTVLDASLAPETRQKRAMSLNMLRARIISEMDSGASGVSPNIRLASVSEGHSSIRHSYDGAGTSNLVGGDDEAHVFWCSACEGDLVVL